MERLKNWLALHRQSLVKKYMNGRLTLICDLEVFMAGKRRKGKSGAAENPQTNGKFLAPVVLKARIMQCADSQDWKQEPVFIKNVEFVQGPDGVIPSFVRFYGIHNEVCDCFGGLVYQPTFDGSYKFIPGFSEWESGEVIVTPKPTKNDLIDCDIERSLEIMEGVSSNERKVFFRKGLSFLEVENVISGFRVLISDKTVEVACLEVRD